jgi:hypothetical protein
MSLLKMLKLFFLFVKDKVIGLLQAFLISDIILISMKIIHNLSSMKDNVTIYCYVFYSKIYFVSVPKFFSVTLADS